jgi:aldehyde:ferredoxin oxidoreductase
MLLAYYQARGWDMETGRPSKEKLLELGLDDIAKDLWG